MRQTETQLKKTNNYNCLKHRSIPTPQSKTDANLSFLERETERERETETERRRDRERQRETERQRQRETERGDKIILYYTTIKI